MEWPECANRRTYNCESFSSSSEKRLLCTTCCEAKVASAFSEGEVWTERHIQPKSYLNAAEIVRRRKMGMQVGALFQESVKHREKRTSCRTKSPTRASSRRQYSQCCRLNKSTITCQRMWVYQNAGEAKTMPLNLRTQSTRTLHSGIPWQ